MIEVHRPLSLAIGDLMLRSALMMMTSDAIRLESARGARRVLRVELDLCHNFGALNSHVVYSMVSGYSPHLYQKKKTPCPFGAE
jgi:hypothetical protein